MKKTAAIGRRRGKVRGAAARIRREKRCGRIFYRGILSAAVCAALICSLRVLDAEAERRRGDGRGAREILSEAGKLAEDWAAEENTVHAQKEIARLSAVAQLCVKQAEERGADAGALREMRQAEADLQKTLNKLLQSEKVHGG